jgi:hypothetical protein
MVLTLQKREHQPALEKIENPAIADQAEPDNTTNGGRKNTQVKAVC